MATQRTGSGNSYIAKAGAAQYGSGNYAAEQAEWNKLTPDQKAEYNRDFYHKADPSNPDFAPPTPPAPGMAGGTGIDLSMGLGAPVLTPEQKADKAVRDGKVSATSKVTGVVNPADPQDVSGLGALEQWGEVHGGGLSKATNTQDGLAGTKAALGAGTASESYNASAQPTLAKNGSAQDAFDLMMKSYQGGGSKVSNNAQSGFDSFDMETPDLSVYYDRQRDKARQALDRSFASRGMYGSSEATGQIGNTMADLGAQQAKDESDFNLRRLAEKRAWGESADKQSLGGAGLEKDFLAGLSSAGGTVDRFTIDKLLAGGTLAENADDGRLKRITASSEADTAADESVRKNFLADAGVQGEIQTAREGRVRNTLMDQLQIPKELAGKTLDSLNNATTADYEAAINYSEAKLGISPMELQALATQANLTKEETAMIIQRSGKTKDQVMSLFGILGKGG